MKIERLHAIGRSLRESVPVTMATGTDVGVLVATVFALASLVACAMILIGMCAHRTCSRVHANSVCASHSGRIYGQFHCECDCVCIVSGVAVGAMLQSVLEWFLLVRGAVFSCMGCCLRACETIQIFHNMVTSRPFSACDAFLLPLQRGLFRG